MTASPLPTRIAMWSGPRNISTAMMRSWGNRSDTTVIDEPFYAYYLKTTGKKHPAAEEIIAAGETDWREVITSLTGPVPNGKQVFFQKQMTHHLLPGVDRQWLDAVINCFLIRDPGEVIASYIKRCEDPTLDDLGFVQQAEIFDFARAKGEPVPAVVDARDVLGDPDRTLRLLCEAIGVAFDKAMLSWPPGLRQTDGVWARHWYDDVAGSTSFRPQTLRKAAVPERLRETHDRCRACYDRLYQHRLH